MPLRISDEAIRAVGWALHPMTAVLVRRGEDTEEQVCEDGGRDWGGAGTSQGPPGAGRSWERPGGPSARALEGTRLAGNLILISWPPELGENPFLWSQSLAICYSSPRTLNTTSKVSAI